MVSGMNGSHHSLSGVCVTFLGELEQAQSPCSSQPHTSGPCWAAGLNSLPGRAQALEMFLAAPLVMVTPARIASCNLCVCSVTH